MQKVLLYYKFVPVKDPETCKLWQKNLCQRLSLHGRIIISDHGINGTVGGDINDLKEYIKETKSFLPFRKMSFKWSDGGKVDFPKLSVKVRPEIITFGAKEELVVKESGVIGSGCHLKPEEVNKLVKEYGEDVIFFDGRNDYESAIGKFKNAITPSVKNAKEFKKEIEKPEYNKLKDKKIITYCTGGVRCEVLSMLMKNRGYKDVYQIDGGIVKYIEKYGDEGLWEGSLYVFDNRISLKNSEKTQDIGKCIHCKVRTSRYINCTNKACNQQILVCRNCKKDTYCILDQNLAIEKK